MDLERNLIQVDVGSQLRHWVRKTEGKGIKTTTRLVSITEFLIIFSTEILNMNKNRCGIIPKISSFTHVNEMWNFDKALKDVLSIIWDPVNWKTDKLKRMPKNKKNGACWGTKEKLLLTNNRHQRQSKQVMERWRDGSAIKSTCCFCRGPRFGVWFLVPPWPLTTMLDSSSKGSNNFF